MNEYSDLTKENRNLLINIINLKINDLPSEAHFRDLCQYLPKPPKRGGLM